MQCFYELRVRPNLQVVNKVIARSAINTYDTIHFDAAGLRQGAQRFLPRPIPTPSALDFDCSHPMEPTCPTPY